jgi:hypothetical protein
MTPSRRTINARKVRRDHHNSYQKATKALLASLPVIQSRELSFVPARRKQFEPHDAQTSALMRPCRSPMTSPR